MSGLLIIIGCISIGIMLFSLLASQWNLSKKIALLLSLVLVLCTILVIATYCIVTNQSLNLMKTDFLLLIFSGVSLLYHLILIIVIGLHQLRINHQIMAITKHYKEK